MAVNFLWVVDMHRQNDTCLFCEITEAVLQLQSHPPRESLHTVQHDTPHDIDRVSWIMDAKGHESHEGALI